VWQIKIADRGIQQNGLSVKDRLGTHGWKHDDNQKENRIEAVETGFISG
jgi:hypothetical protein